MNFVAWLYVTASVVIQGLFPPTVDSPLANEQAPRNYSADSEADAEFEILGLVTSALADGFFRMITAFGPTEDKLEFNEADNVETEDEFFYSIGRLFASLKLKLYSRTLAYVGPMLKCMLMLFIIA